MEHRLLAFLFLTIVPELASGQAIVEVSRTRLHSLPDNTVVAVTTDGLWIPAGDSASPLLHIPASDFLGERGTLTRPAIEWNRRADTFIVSSGAQLFSVRIIRLAPPAWAIEDITPDPGTLLNLYDLDIHPSTGELFLLDQTNNEVLRFPPPFEADMLPTLVLPVPATSRAMAVDSRSYPPAVIVTETSQTTRVEFDGNSQLLNYFTNGRGIDQDPQYAGSQGAYMAATSSNQISKATGSPGVNISMNYLGFCTPLVREPTDLQWNPIKQRAYAFADDGVNQMPACTIVMPASGPNHIVVLPHAQAPPFIVPKLYTNAADSGITGTKGDLTAVLGDFAYMSPYGDGCSVGNPDAIRLDSVSIPYITATELVFEVSNGPANGAVQFVVGTLPIQVPVAGGCDLLVSPDLVLAVGTTDAQGRLDFTWPLPMAPTEGLDVFVQVAVEDGGAQDLTQALRVHFGQ